MTVEGEQAMRGARDLVGEAEEHALVRQSFVRHALTRLPLVGAFVITINLFVQVRGDIGLAVAIAQNLTFGAIAVIVLLNLVVYIILGVMVASMPLVFDDDYNRWTRLVGSALIVLLAIVIGFTASWLLLIALVGVFAVIGIVVRRGRRKPFTPLDRKSVVDTLMTSSPPVDAVLRRLWAEGRAMLRATTTASTTAATPAKLPVTPEEAALVPRAEPKPFAAVAREFNDRMAQIRDPRVKSLTRLAFAGIVGFILLFGLNVFTQPIRFAPLEMVSVKSAPAEPGFVLLQGTRGMFVPKDSGAAQFITADQITSIELCDDAPQWWTVSVVLALHPQARDGVDCQGN